MAIYHLNCGSLHPLFPKALAIIYCLLVETNQGLLLVDTGFGLKDYSQPSLRMRFFLYLMGVRYRNEETAAYQIAEMGFDVNDVRHIVLTHLHLDHAGGLRDFPQAEVHVYRPEYEAATNPRSLMEYAYEPSQWAHDPKWILHDRLEEDWYGFRGIRILDGLVPDVLLIPLTGHTRGHCGVAIETPDGWLFHCGDAASPFHRGTDLHNLGSDRHLADVFPAEFARRVIGPHVPRLRSLTDGYADQVTVISAHDIYSFSKHRKEERT